MLVLLLLLPVHLWTATTTMMTGVVPGLTRKRPRGAAKRLVVPDKPAQLVVQDKPAQLVVPDKPAQLVVVRQQVCSHHHSNPSSSNKSREGKKGHVVVVHRPVAIPALLLRGVHPPGVRGVIRCVGCVARSLHLGRNCLPTLKLKDTHNSSDKWKTSPLLVATK